MGNHTVQTEQDGVGMLPRDVDGAAAERRHAANGALAGRPEAEDDERWDGLS